MSTTELPKISFSIGKRELINRSNDSWYRQLWPLVFSQKLSVQVKFRAGLLSTSQISFHDYFFLTKIDNPMEVVINIKFLQRKTLTNSWRNNNDSKRSNFLRKIFKEEYMFDSQHDTFKLFLYIQSKTSAKLGLHMNRQPQQLN